MTHDVYKDPRQDWKYQSQVTHTDTTAAEHIDEAPLWLVQAVA